MHYMLLDTPTNGHISIDGEESTKLRRKQLDKMRNKNLWLRVSAIFHECQRYRTGQRYGAAVNCTSQVLDRKKIAMNAPEQVDLTDKAESRANDLSAAKSNACASRELWSTIPRLFLQMSQPAT